MYWTSSLAKELQPQLPWAHFCLFITLDIFEILAGTCVFSNLGFGMYNNKIILSFINLY